MYHKHPSTAHMAGHTLNVCSGHQAGIKSQTALKMAHPGTKGGSNTKTEKRSTLVQHAKGGLQKGSMRCVQCTLRSAPCAMCAQRMLCCVQSTKVRCSQCTVRSVRTAMCTACNVWSAQCRGLRSPPPFCCCSSSDQQAAANTHKWFGSGGWCVGMQCGMPQRVREYLKAGGSLQVRQLQGLGSRIWLFLSCSV